MNVSYPQLDNEVGECQHGVRGGWYSVLEPVAQELLQFLESGLRTAWTCHDLNSFSVHKYEDFTLIKTSLIR